MWHLLRFVSRGFWTSVFIYYVFVYFVNRMECVSDVLTCWLWLAGKSHTVSLKWKEEWKESESGGELEQLADKLWVRPQNQWWTPVVEEAIRPKTKIWGFMSMCSQRVEWLDCVAAFCWFYLWAERDRETWSVDHHKPFEFYVIELRMFGQCDQSLNIVNVIKKWF